jgi:hypothetical protein
MAKFDFVAAISLGLFVEVVLACECRRLLDIRYGWVVQFSPRPFVPKKEKDSLPPQTRQNADDQAWPRLCNCLLLVLPPTASGQCRGQAG